MYQNIDGHIVITVNDWINAGLSMNVFRNDSKRGDLSIFRRSTGGNTLINVKSIKRPDRLQKIEHAFGTLKKEEKQSIFTVEIDHEARKVFLSYERANGQPLEPEKVEEYVNRASILNGLKRGLEKQREARGRVGKNIPMSKFWQQALSWYNEQSKTYPCKHITNARSLERIFKSYLKNGYHSIVHKSTGNDFARIVSVDIKNLFLALWRTYDKPFVNTVHERYLEFISGERELFDQSTGELFKPDNFRYKGRAMEVSIATVWNYLKDVINETSVYTDRNGNFDYTNKKRPKQHRKLGRFSLSKISMDDVAMSRKSVRGWVYKYMSVDVVSGYWFRPAYIVGKPNQNTIIEAFRNMFCELVELGLPMPGELEVENHLMKDIPWLNDLFAFVRFCTSSTEKRAEHAIKSLKYGVSKKNGNMNGRWYAKHEAFRCVRNKKNGDYINPEYQPQNIVADDLKDIDEHNNSLHPLQKTYPGMTRKEVLLSQVNPKLEPIAPYYLYKFIGNKTETSIYNNDYCPVQNEEFELIEFKSLKKLKSNNTSVTAYWLPESDGSINKVYLYQDKNYIGQALNRLQFAYNENTIERTTLDEANIQHQNKRLAQYDKYIKEHRKKLAKIGSIKANAAKDINTIKVQTIPENKQPEAYELDCGEEDWAQKAINSL